MVDLKQVTTHLFICNGATCLRYGGDQVASSIRQEIREQGLSKQIHTTLTKCNGQCHHAPIVIEYPQGNWYGQLKPELATSLIRSIQRYDILKENLVYSLGENQIYNRDRKN